MAISTALSQTLNANANAWNGFTVVMQFPASVLTLPSSPITGVRVTFEAGTTEGLTVTNAYIGHRAGSGDAYDFSTTPVQLLWGGASSIAIGSGASSTSDMSNFQYDKTSDMLIAFYIGGGTTVDMMRERTGLSASIVQYNKAANDAATVNKTGYGSNTGRILAINTIEVLTEDGNFFIFF